MVDREILLKVLAAKAGRFEEVSTQLEDPAVVADHNRVRDLSREHGQLGPFARLHSALVKNRDELAEAQEFAAGDDAEMAELAQTEIPGLDEEAERLWNDAETQLAEDDDLGHRDVMLEVRGAVGGDEAALFAGDLFAMYTHFCAKHRLKLEVLHESAGEMGGFKEIVAEVRGRGAYKHLRFESGGHRVQRVPKTETQGRIHTSLATVAVMPKAEEVDIQIDWDKDVREDKMRAGGPGGQKVNKTESAIRLTHLETGLTVHMQDEKSQHKNRSSARRILAARVFDHFQRQAHAAEAAQRKGMIGSGDRSDRVRTYNFPQNRVTDHRVDFSKHDIPGVLMGELEPFHERLALREREDRLLALVEDAG